MIVAKAVKFRVQSIEMSIILFVCAVTSLQLLALNVNALSVSSGINNYEVHSIKISCPFSTEFLSNVTCYVKRINRTSENYALDVFIKPGVKVYALFVSNNCDVAKKYLPFYRVY